MKHNNLLFAFAVGCVLAFGIHEARADNWWLDRPVVATTAAPVEQPVQRVEMIAPVISPLQSPVAAPTPVPTEAIVLPNEEDAMNLWCVQNGLPKFPDQKCWDAWNTRFSQD